ncbi:MAG: histidine--tRNA ligase, partial [Phycisphaerae bacterium]|nr:histidine--tRNA ligase [Phycisphaerae bacterium]
MALQAPKGTRDFYPPDMARLNYIFDAWRRVSVRNGFVEFDSPAFETLELYTAKSGEEIVSQLFRMTDRGGRELALRPELTPSLARMVNQRASSLALPIKWFSIPRLWRGENVQRGRLREFFQWNIDIVGAAETIADAEAIYVAVDSLRELGLTAADIVVRISSRPLLAAVLRSRGVPEAQLAALYTIVDKQAKVPPDKFAAMLSESLAAAGVADATRAAGELIAAIRCADLDALPVAGEDADREKASLQSLFRLLGDFGIADYCQFDLGIVRGLAYYTGPVFEIYDRAGAMRAVAGGGRYDNLLEVLGGPKMPAVGFGMGDVVLADLLDTLGKLPTGQGRIDAFLIDAEERFFPEVVKLAGALRSKGVAATFSYRRAGVSKQFKQASQANARFAIILGAELASGQVAVKDLASGQQKLVPLDQLIRD